MSVRGDPEWSVMHSDQRSHNRIIQLHLSLLCKTHIGNRSCPESEQAPLDYRGALTIRTGCITACHLRSHFGTAACDLAVVEFMVCKHHAAFEASVFVGVPGIVSSDSACRGGKQTHCSQSS
jgi:hypothetical protein